MRIIDILSSDKCRPLFLEVQKFVADLLSKYNDSIERNGFRFLEKDIFDFVWGTVNFSSAEICVLDSPLLQRLRRIRQLGLASTVYCNADSSRFSHTIGVTEVAGRMARRVTQKLGDGALQNDCFDAEEIVRLAAIFHDAGHMFFSHVSELYFSYDKSFPRCKEIIKAKTYFAEQTSAEVALHELISVMIVNSPETIRLFKIIAPHMKNSRLTQQSHYENLAEYISCLIIGVPINKFILPYSTIINSALDADKLDYLSRDSACTKVPIAVDIARIIQKLDVVIIRNIEFPNIWNDASSEAIPLKVMAIANSARNVFWQLSNARSSMYESVYYHHKVLTAETMFRLALRKLYETKSGDQISFSDILHLTDDVFNEFWDKILLSKYERESYASQEISKILECVRNRNLYKRVAAFSQDKLIAPLSRKGEFLHEIVQNPLSDEYRAFCNTLEEEYKKINKLLGSENQQENNPVFLFIYSKYEPMSSVPVESGDGFCLWSSNLMKQETMETGKKSKQEQYYLLTNCIDRDNVYLALEKSLAKFGITRLSKDAAICSKVDPSQLNEKRRRLLECNYYHDALFVLHDDIFMTLINQRQFQSILQKYSSFTGVNFCRITSTRLTVFLRQFLWLDLTANELKLLIAGILNILDSAYYLDRDSFAIQVGKLFGEELSKIKCAQKHIVMLGGLLDSSSHLAYYLNDVKDKDSITIDGSIQNALRNAKEDDCICFFDDGAYSGKQVISIFQEFMGVPEMERTTNEHHVDELTADQKDKLKQTKIVLAYLCFNPQSEEYIKSEFLKIGLTDITICYTHDLSRKIFDMLQPYFTTSEQQQIVKKYLQQIGCSILMSTKKLENGEFKPRWDEKRVTDAALGYNDAQQFVVFSTNIPTYSITPFWANGRLGDREWVGLFQRTNKD